MKQEEEYQSLALKCALLLKDILHKKQFHKEGTIQQRMEKYEAKSNFLEKFVKEFTCEGSDIDYITGADFYKKFVSWCRENRHRELSETSVGIGLKKLSIEQEKRYFNWLFDGKGGQLRCWINIKWKD